MTNQLSTAEQMALAVLRGDLLAARALADHLLEDLFDLRGATKQLPPLRKLTEISDRLRVVVYLKDNAVEGNSQQVQRFLYDTRKTIREWLKHGQPALCYGVDRVEIYEITPPDEEQPKAEYRKKQKENLSV